VTAAVDVVVVGSGLVGAVVAREVRTLLPVARLLVVDAAPVVGGTPGAHLLRAGSPEARSAYRRYAGPDWGRDGRGMPAGLANAGAFGHDVSRFPGMMLAWNVGGMGSHWAGACPAPRGDEVPSCVTPENWNAAFSRALELLRVTGDFNDCWPDDAPLRALRAEFPSRGVRPMPMAGARRADGVFERTGSVDVLPGLAGADGDLTTLLGDTLCTAVEHEGGVARGVRLRHVPTGTETEVAASAVVLAADAVRTPQLLFASGIRPPALGRWLNEHAMLRTRFTVPVPRGAGEEELEAAWWVPVDTGRLRTTGFVSATRPAGDVIEYELNWFCRTEPDEDDRIEFGGVDLLGMPAATFHHRQGRVDRELVDAAGHELVQASRALGAPAGTAVEELPLGLSLHATGTVRVGGVDDGTCVAAPDGRVWSTRNLFVAGNGAVPGALSCNTTATAAALAVLAARGVHREVAGAEP
jgi:choline dehydrogenase-like flavoprotein